MHSVLAHGPSSRAGPGTEPISNTHIKMEFEGFEEVLEEPNLN